MRQAAFLMSKTDIFAVTVIQQASREISLVWKVVLRLVNGLEFVAFG